MNEREHDELRSLLGAVALNAASTIEARRVERHVQTCTDCALEMRMLKETAAELAWLAEPDDDAGLVDRISEALPARPRRLITRISVAVAAVSVIIAGALGSFAIRERSVNSQLSDVLADASQHITLKAAKGFDGDGVLHLASGGRAALVLDDLPDAGRDRTYQLWALRGSEPSSMTVVDGAGRVVHLFDWEGKADMFAVTIEPAGGSPVPTSDPVLIGS